MLDKLKISVFKANLDLVDQGLVIHTWERKRERQIYGTDSDKAFRSPI
jgi:hypothetical protein